MDTPCQCPFEGHKYGRRKQTETSIFKFSYLCVNLLLEKLMKMESNNFYPHKECLDGKILNNQ